MGVEKRVKKSLKPFIDGSMTGKQTLKKLLGWKGLLKKKKNAGNNLLIRNAERTGGQKTRVQAVIETLGLW